jgi:FkbM family methyltransferase
MKNIIKKILPEIVKEKLLEWNWLITNRKIGISYSQQGEDILLIKSEIISLNKKGFYVDIGANHPKVLSNTYLFYKAGWNGINIDPIPNMLKKFKNRKRDINLNIGISNNPLNIDYFLYKTKQLNTLDKKVVEELKKKNIFPEKSIKIKTQKLYDVLKKYAPNKEIDFINIDVEGLELDVLKSNNWDEFKPKIIIIEIHNINLSNLEDNEVHVYLEKLGYKLFARTPYNSLYKKI